MADTMPRVSDSIVTTPVARVLDRLADAKATLSGWQARCPAHEDARASLSIAAGDDGRALLHCHAGCAADAVVCAIGLTLRDLMPAKAPTTRPKVVATYEYNDEHGTHLFDVVRFEPKDFRQRRADGKWSMAGVRRVPYRLPNLAGCTSCFIVEGEKDADALAALGLPATCNVGGAGRWRDDYTAMLSACGITAVCVLADNDDPGRAHALDVARHCHAAGLEARILELPDLPAKGDVCDWLAAGGTRGELMALAKSAPLWTPGATLASTTTAAEAGDTTAPVPRDGDDADEANDEKPARKASMATELVELTEALGVELWHTPNGDAFATVRVGDHREHHPLRRVVRDYLSREYYRGHKRTATSAALTDAAATLSGMARYDGAEHPVAVRLAAHDGAVYLDLGTPDWQAVEIDPTGWRLVETSPVRHWRPGSLRALPVPTPGGTLDALRALWPIDDTTWTLAVSWLVAAAAPNGPYPVLVETGEQGSGKSTFGRMLRGLLDPAAPDLRGVPRDERDVMIGALTSHVLALDNLSGLPVWLSDVLCRVATGGGLATRTLYSDLDETTIDVCRPILLTGIDSPASRGDLLDRALVITLPAIADETRGDERALWGRYHAMRPALVGALCDAIACALRRQDEIVLVERPRMADACSWVTAAEPALGWPSGRTAEAWLGARQQASADLIASDLVAQAVLGLPKPWTGSAGELLKILTAVVSESTARAKGWPTSPRGLSGALRRLAPDLRRSGVEITDTAREAGTGRRGLSIVTTVTPSQIGGFAGEGAGSGTTVGCDGCSSNAATATGAVTPRGADSSLCSSDSADRDGRDGCDGSGRPVSGGRRVAI